LALIIIVSFGLPSANPNSSSDSAVAYPRSELKLDIQLNLLSLRFGATGSSSVIQSHELHSFLPSSFNLCKRSHVGSIHSFVV
jgi:hypothetical protein